MPAERRFRLVITCDAHPPASPWRYVPNRLRPPSARNGPTVIVSRELDGLHRMSGPDAVIAVSNMIDREMFTARLTPRPPSPWRHQCDLGVRVENRPAGVEWGTHPPHPATAADPTDERQDHD